MKNGDGCESAATPVTINAAPNTPAAPTATATQPTCTNGNGTITVTNPTTGVTYSFDNGANYGTSNTSGALSPGTYQVRVKNGDGCESAATPVTINAAPNTPAAPQASVAQPTCTNGNGTITVTNPTTGVTYSFDNGASYGASNTSGALSPGTYQVRVKNGDGCESAATPVTINAAPNTPAAPQASVAQPTCTNGNGTITVTNPTTGVTYSFDNGASYGASNTSGALSPGTYQVRVKNGDGCESAATPVTINAAPNTPAAPQASVAQPTCTNGNGTITVTNPTTGVTYSFDNGASYGASNTSGALSPGTYQVRVKNGDGCESAATPVTINAAPNTPAAPQASVAQPTCTNGNGTITVTNPTTGVTYSFDNGASYGASNTSGALSPGTYQVRVKNGDGCESAATPVTINAAPNTPAAPQASVAQPTCTNGNGTITVTNPTTGVTYSFDNGASYGASNTSGALSPGTYQVRVKNGDGCESAATPVTINAQPATPTVTVNNPTICAGTSAQLTVQGCDGTIAWSTNESQASISVTPGQTTSYTVTCTANGCVGTATATVTVNPKPVVTVTATTCNGLTTYTVTFTATAGAMVSANIGTVSGNQVTNIPSGQTVTLTATLNTCEGTTTANQNCQSQAASLGDQTFVDTNGDGIQNNGEVAFANVVVTLISNGNVVATATTDANGLYSFTGLTPGTPYSVSFTTPTGYTATTYPGGTSPTVTLAPGEINLTLDAGFLLLRPAYRLTKIVDLKQVERGQVVTYTVSLTNTSNTTATNLALTDQLSTTAITFVGSASTSAGTYAPTASGGTWTIPTLAGGQVVTLRFQVRLDQEGIVYNTITTPDGKSATACTTVPYHVCANTPFLFELRAPINATSYQWSRNGQPITGATASTLSVSAIGEYTVAAVNGSGCPDGTCCPFVVVEDPAPSITVRAVAATCTGNVPQANGFLGLVSNSPNAVSYNIAAGNSFTATTPTFATPQPLASVSGGVLLASLANPALAAGQPYTVRVYTADGCFSDTAITLPQTVCDCPVGVCAPVLVRKTKVNGRPIPQ